jgi:hypothetical protein
VARLALPHFFIVSHKWQNFLKKKNIEHKSCDWFYLQHFYEICVILRRTNTVKVVKIERLRWLGQLFRMQELDPCRNLNLHKPKRNRRIGKPKARWFESVEEYLKKMGMRNCRRK